MNYTLSGSSVHEDPPDKNTGVGCQVFLQGVFPTQILCLMHWAGGVFSTMNTTWEAWKGTLKVSRGKIHLCIPTSVLPIIITLPLITGNIIKLPLRDIAKRSDLDIKFTEQLKLLEEEVIVLESY